MSRHGQTLVSIWLPDELYEKLEDLRWGLRMSRSEFVRQAILDKIEGEGGETP